MNETPLVSVITPCYNSGRFVGRYIECLLKQTYSRIQLIIVNDGSTDDTEQIVKSYEKKLTRLGISLTYKYQANQGLGGAINTGLKLVEGDFFTWCDSDNLLTEDYFEENIRFFLSHPESSILRCDGYNVLDSDLTYPLSKMSEGIRDKHQRNLFINCLTSRDFYFGCTMLRTSAFDNINPQREIFPSREGQNWQIMLPMFYHYESDYIDKPLFYFVIREDSISHVARHKGFAAMIAQNNACEETEATVIKTMHIPEEKQYLDIVYKQYALIRFWIADEFGEYDYVKKEYQRINAHGWSNPEVERAYRRWRNPLWRIRYKIEHNKSTQKPNSRGHENGFIVASGN